jgi:isocitrate dehydrogenase (NAD+)
MKTYRVTELLGDGISAELSAAVHTISGALPCKLTLEPVDLSLERRRRDGKKAYDEALASMRRTKVSLKYPTTTDSESPNKVLRELCHFSVIHRPCATIPGVPTNFKRPIDVDIVRVATGGTYDDAGRRIGPHSAVSVRVIEREPCVNAARFAFELAARRGKTVISSSKYTIQRATDGLFEEAVDEVAEKFPNVQHSRILFDALLAKLALNPQRVQVVVCPNEYGDFLSDCAAGLIGSLGLADSASYSFDKKGRVSLAMFDPAGGTAPDIAGKDLVNPTAALFALCTMLAHLGELKTSARLRKALHACLARRQTTRDLGGRLTTSDYTRAVVKAFAKS